ncbi:MAG TPA: GDSL-type esterase/lipase family protein [Acidimicrobiales bacterium]|nr:GDSL-type esterase/lipase family protein [Acidimicrobiales bacterium]
MDSSKSLSRSQLLIRFPQGLHVGRDPDISADSTLELEQDAILILGDRVSIRRGTTIQVSRGATLEIGDDVSIGEHCFISALVGIRVGDGCGISNMVDIHDVNHRYRDEGSDVSLDWTPYASGFSGSPIVIESGAIVSNKCSLTAGVRIGYNSVIGANSVVTRSIPPNSMAAGAPAFVRKTFPGPAPPRKIDAHEVRMVFFGTSIVEHLEGYSERLSQQWDLPAVGSVVTVEGWRSRGFVHRLYLSLQTSRPHIRFLFLNKGRGGATSRDLLTAVTSDLQELSGRPDLAFYGCGINDVWRGFQGRASEAVSLPEYASNYEETLRIIQKRVRRLVCLGETPFGPSHSDEMNKQLVRYNDAAEATAKSMGVQFIDLWSPARRTGRELAYSTSSIPEPLSIWSDDTHLSELGDSLLAQLVEEHLVSTGLLAELEQYEALERSRAVQAYRHLFAGIRAKSMAMPDESNADSSSEGPSSH